MLQLKTVTPQFADFDKVSALYHSAFPENERRPLEEMFSFLSGGGEFLALYDGETFCGFVCLLSWQDITHILYLAIDSQLRGRGYGTGMLSAIRQRYPHSRLIADIELETTDAPNNAERRQRKHFYQKSGYRSSEVQYRWREESYEIIVSGGDFDKADFRSFWNAFGVSKGVFSKA